MRQRTYELWYALAAMIGLTLVYVPIATQGIPRASGVLGHGLGILGFLLMLSTETLYSLRKRARGKAIGRMSTWLQIHIFTGLVGPFMVLLHSAWKFNGLAGVLMLMTIIIVLSGIVGRYIYTAVPRTVDGAEIAARRGHRDRIVIQTVADRRAAQKLPALPRRRRPSTQRQNDQSRPDRPRDLEHDNTS